MTLTTSASWQTKSQSETTTHKTTENVTLPLMDVYEWKYSKYLQEKMIADSYEVTASLNAVNSCHQSNNLIASTPINSNKLVLKPGVKSSKHSSTSSATQICAHMVQPDVTNGITVLKENLAQIDSISQRSAYDNHLLSKTDEEKGQFMNTKNTDADQSIKKCAKVINLNINSKSASDTVASRLLRPPARAGYYRHVPNDIRTTEHDRNVSLSNSLVFSTDTSATSAAVTADMSVAKLVYLSSSSNSKNSVLKSSGAEQKKQTLSKSSSATSGRPKTVSFAPMATQRVMSSWNDRLPIDGTIQIIKNACFKRPAFYQKKPLF